MQQTAENKLLQELAVLAEKLGTTAEYLWSALLRQAFISGILDIFYIVALILSVFLWVQFVRRKISIRKGQARAEWSDPEGCFFAWAGVFIALLMSALIVASLVSSAVSAFLNPEYWALQQILR